MKLSLPDVIFTSFWYMYFGVPM